MKIFSHSGHLGDVIYSLPTIKILSGDEGAAIYIKEIFEDHRGHINGNTGQEAANYTQFDALYDLLMLQPYIKEVRRFIPENGDYSPHHWPTIEGMIDYDLDKSRLQGQRRFVYHVQRYFDAFGIAEDWRQMVPWLVVDEDQRDALHNYAIFHITDRWHGFSVDWSKIYRDDLHKYDRVYFTGYRGDYEKFEARYSTLIQYLPTNTLLDLTRVIRDSQAVYCNQNCSLPIAQGLGKKYFLARNADRTHCHTGLLNETLLNETFL